MMMRCTVHFNNLINSRLYPFSCFNNYVQPTVLGAEKLNNYSDSFNKIINNKPCYRNYCEFRQGHIFKGHSIQLSCRPMQERFHSLHSSLQLNESNFQGDNDHDLVVNNLLQNLSAEDAKRLKVLRLELDVLFSTGVRVPDDISEKDWLHILHNLPTIHARKRYYKYLFSKEKAKINHKLKAERNQEEGRKKYAERLRQVAEEGPDALPFKNSFFMRIQEKTMNQFWYSRLFYAMLNGPHLLFDFGFNEFMSRQEISNMISQLQLCYGMNKVNSEPFHFHFCNVNTETREALMKSIGNLDSMPISVSQEHYSKLYDPSRLVYLSPNAPLTMDKFEVDDVYIVGALVDKAKEDKMSLARAKEDKIRCLRFPLDENVRWIQGSKSLTLNQVVQILLHIKSTGNWKDSLLKALPLRKYSTK